MTNNESPFSYVLATPAATPETAHQHYLNKLSVETDAADVRLDLESGQPQFLLVDARSAEDYAQCHIPSAISLPHRTISQETTAHFDKDKVIVVYCWGPACNGATKAAVRLSALGFRVKEMLGGIEYWRREGNAVEGTLAEQAPLIG